MEKKEKLRFCFYCGALLPPYKEGKITYCVYCGTKLNYKSNIKIEKPENEILSS
jgi:hypothetical protein